MDTSPTLYLLMGLPGAGKTTTAQIIHLLTGAVHLSSDDTRLAHFARPTFSEDEHSQLYALLDDMTRKLLQEGKSVIYDANLNRAIHREEKYHLAKKVPARVVLLWVQTPTDIAKYRRIKSVRQQLIPPRENPGSMFDKIARTIEPPTADEQYLAIDGKAVSETTVAEQLKNAHDAIA